tara:strand:- start:551 stop:922 length:372 start_codon:yes stop_codon:yes gene_type:complete
MDNLDGKKWEDNELRLEQEQLMTFVKKHPYPSFEDVCGELDYQSFAEYGTVNHELCKRIYENSTNDKIILEAGKQIYARGGITALRENHYVLQRFYNHPDGCIRSHPKWIEIVWQDVCDQWRA